MLEEDGRESQPLLGQINTGNCVSRWGIRRCHVDSVVNREAGDIWGLGNGEKESMLLSETWLWTCQLLEGQKVKYGSPMKTGLFLSLVM